MKNAFSNLSRWVYSQPETDYFRSEAFLATAGSVAFVAWVWVGQSVAADLVHATHGLILMGLVGVAGWAILRFYRSHYFHAVIIFLVTQLLLISAMMIILQDLSLGYLFLFTIVMAGSLVSGVGSFGTASMAAIVESALVYFSSSDVKSAELLPVLILLQYL